MGVINTEPLRNPRHEDTAQELANTATIDVHYARTGPESAYTARVQWAQPVTVRGCGSRPVHGKYATQRGPQVAFRRGGSAVGVRWYISDLDAAACGAVAMSIIRRAAEIVASREVTPTRLLAADAQCALRDRDEARAKVKEAQEALVAATERAEAAHQAWLKAAKRDRMEGKR